MALIDAKTGAVVIRVVYDGAPLAGKTTTLQALGRMLGVEVHTPETHYGRTLFFDWLDYQGGMFEGRAIRCQLVTVPGQESLRARRDHLLKDADVVVLVADTRAGRLGAALALYRSVQRLARAQDPPLGVVVQANQRDAPDAQPLHTLQEQLGTLAPVRIVETVATEGSGVREGFVFAVRLALDRVRALTRAGTLEVGRARTNSAAELLAALSEVEVQLPKLSGEPTAAPLTKTSVRARGPIARPAPPVSSLTPGDEQAPVLTPSVPGGFIWPPVDGRLILANAAGANLTPKRLPSGDWSARRNGWRLFSWGDAIEDDSERGRQRLIDEARAHTRWRELLTVQRALVLLPAGGRSMRLWHVVREERSLADRVQQALSEKDASAVATHLTIVADQLVRARDQCLGVVDGLPCRLGGVSAHAGAPPRFVGVLPRGVAQRAAEPTGKALLVRELAGVIMRIKQRRRDQAHIGEALDRLSAQSAHAGAAILVEVWKTSHG